MTRPRNVTERRLRRGAVVMKTASVDARHGAFWTYPETGRLAAASVCARLERIGLLETRDGLFPDCGGQTYRLKPEPPKPEKVKPKKLRKSWRDPTKAAPARKRRRKVPESQPEPQP